MARSSPRCTVASGPDAENTNYSEGLLATPGGVWCHEDGGKQLLEAKVTKPESAQSALPPPDRHVELNLNRFDAK